MGKHTTLLNGKIINPQPLAHTVSLVDLIDRTFFPYNAGRMIGACHVFTQKMLKDDVLVGMSLAGALTPAGLGRSCILPLMEHGFVAYLDSTVALPIMTAYTLNQCVSKPHKHLYEKRTECGELLQRDFLKKE